MAGENPHRLEGRKKKSGIAAGDKTDKKHNPIRAGKSCEPIKLLYVNSLPDSERKSGRNISTRPRAIRREIKPNRKDSPKN